ncbi:MAG: AAA family ATPase, partial [Gemmataceae bacterium]
MIPQRIKLKGFLCYKDEQSIDFQGSATLWMLSGLNGSGKSAIFDAVTYALFGHHRGGATGAVELINKDSDTLAVEFDFLLDGHLCRAKRTLKRDAKGGARGTQQMFHQADGKFLPIEETGQKREFDKWVADNIGLNYDTFTSSVLLLQGKAEKLLDSRPEGRREVLASIVNLERYERLHAKADEKRKGVEGHVKALNQRLAALPQVDPLELGAARLRIGEAEEARNAARSEVERLQSLETMSRLWQALQAQLAQARARHGRARELMAGSAAIEQAMDRLRELREVCPRLHEITVLRGQANQAAQSMAVLESQRQLKLGTRAERESAVRQAEERRRTLQQRIDAQARQERESSERLRGLALQISRLGEVERHEQEAARVRQDLAGLPADPAALVAAAREALERAEAVGRLVPVLERFRLKREELTHERAAAKQADEGMRTVQERGSKLKAEAEAGKKRREEAAAALALAAEQATEARTLSAQARQAVAELSQLDGSHVCRHCGQALTAGHMDEERRRRSKEEKAADARAKAAQQGHDRAKEQEQDARAGHEKAEADYLAAREEYRDHRSRVERSKEAIERLQRECAAVYGELPADHAARVSKKPASDWATTVYP